MTLLLLLDWLPEDDPDLELEEETAVWTCPECGERYSSILQAESCCQE